MRNIEEFIDQQIFLESKEVKSINSLILEALESSSTSLTNKTVSSGEDIYAKIPNRGNASEFFMFIELLKKFQAYCSSKNIKLSTLGLDSEEHEGEKIRRSVSISDAIKEAKERIKYYLGGLKADPKKDYQNVIDTLDQEAKLAVNKLFDSTFFQNEYLLKDEDERTVKQIQIATTGVELSGRSTADLEIKIIFQKNKIKPNEFPVGEENFRISLKRGNVQAYASSRYVSRETYTSQSKQTIPPADGTIQRISAPEGELDTLEQQEKQTILKSSGGGPIKMFYLFGFEQKQYEQQLDVLQEKIDKIYEKYTTPPFVAPSSSVNTDFSNLLKERKKIIGQAFEEFKNFILQDFEKNPQSKNNIINIFYNLLTRSDKDVRAYIDTEKKPSILFTPLMEIYSDHILKLDVEVAQRSNTAILFKIPQKDSIKKFEGTKESGKTLDANIYTALNKLLQSIDDTMDRARLEDEDKYNRLLALFNNFGISALKNQPKDLSNRDTLKSMYDKIISTSNQNIEKLVGKELCLLSFEASTAFNFQSYAKEYRKKYYYAEKYYNEFLKEKQNREKVQKSGQTPPAYTDKILNLFLTQDYLKLKTDAAKQRRLPEIFNKLDAINNFDKFKDFYFKKRNDKRIEAQWKRLSPRQQAGHKTEESFRQKILDSEGLELDPEKEGTTKFLVGKDFKNFISILNEMYEFEKTDPTLKDIFLLINVILRAEKRDYEKKSSTQTESIIREIILEQLDEKEYSKVMKKVNSCGAKGLISAVPSNKTANTIAVRFDTDESIDSGIKKVKSSLRSSGYELENKRVLKFDQKRDTTDVIKNGNVVARLFFRADIKERKGLAYEHIIGAVLTKKITSQLKNRIDLPPDASKEEVMKKLKSEEFGKLFQSAKKAAPLITQKVGNIVSAESVGSTNNKADFVLKTDSGKTVGLSAKYAAGEKDNEYKMNKVLGFGTEDDSLVRNPKGIPWWIVGRKTFLKKLKSQTSSFSGREYNPDPEDLDAPAWMKAAKESNPDIYKETMEDVYATIRNILTINLKKLGLKGLIAFVNEADLGKEEERQNYDTFLKVIDGPSGLSVTEISLDGVQTDGLDQNINIDQIVIQDRSDIIIKIPGHDELKINSVKFKSDMLSSKAGDLKIKTR